MGAILSSFISVPMRIFRRIGLLYDLRTLKSIKLAKAKQRIRDQQGEQQMRMQLVMDYHYIQQPRRPIERTKLDKYLNMLRQIFSINQV